MGPDLPGRQYGASWRSRAPFEQWHDASMSKGRSEIYLLRHADAGDPEAWRGPDAERPLSAKGTRQADRLGAFLAGIGFRPDAIVSSPKVRASQTAEIVAQALGASVALDDRLAEGFGLADLGAMLEERSGPGRIVLVGHDPDFSATLGELVRTKAIPMPKGALARVDVDGPPRAGAGVLRWLLPPEALKPSA